MADYLPMFKASKEAKYVNCFVSIHNKLNHSFFVHEYGTDDYARTFRHLESNRQGLWANCRWTDAGWDSISSSRIAYIVHPEYWRERYG